MYWLFFVIMFNQFIKILSYNEKAWKMEKPDMAHMMSQLLNVSYEENNQFKTFFNLVNNENTYRDIKDHMTLYEEELFVGENNINSTILNFASRPARIALQVVAATVPTMLQLENELEMRNIVRDVYEDLLPTVDKPTEEFSIVGRQLFAFSHIDGKPIEENYLDNMEQLKALGQYSYFKNGKFDKYIKKYDEETYKFVISTIEFWAEKYIDELIENNSSKFKRIKNPLPNNRVTGFMSGGNGSGKSTSEKLMKKYFLDKGVDFKDVVRLSTDMFKPIVLHIMEEEFVLSDSELKWKEKFSHIAQHEASIIKKIAQKKLSRKIGYHSKEWQDLLQKHYPKDLERGKYQLPHVIFDQVFPPDLEQINYALEGGGSLNIIVVSTDVASAIERSYIRGQKGKRFESRVGILETHRAVVNDITRFLPHFGGEKITLTLVDNNVAFGQEPIRVMKIDFKEKKIIIYDEEKFNRFLKKTTINIKALTPDEAYLKEPVISIEEYLEPFTRNFFVIQPLATDQTMNTQKIQENMAKKLSFFSIFSDKISEDKASDDLGISNLCGKTHV